MVGKGPHRDHNGELILTNPMAGNKMALIAADDIGKTALGVFRRGDEFIGKTVSIASAPVTGEQLAAVLGEKVVHRTLSHDEVRASGQPGRGSRQHLPVLFGRARILHRSPGP